MTSFYCLIFYCILQNVFAFAFAKCILAFCPLLLPACDIRIKHCSQHINYNQLT